MINLLHAYQYQFREGWYKSSKRIFVLLIFLSISILKSVISNWLISWNKIILLLCIVFDNISIYICWPIIDCFFTVMQLAQIRDYDSRLYIFIYWVIILHKHSETVNMFEWIWIAKSKKKNIILIPNQRFRDYFKYLAYDCNKLTIKFRYKKMSILTLFFVCWWLILLAVFPQIQIYLWSIILTSTRTYHYGIIFLRGSSK